MKAPPDKNEHGVPHEESHAASQRRAAATKLHQGKLELLRLLWCDNANMVRVKSVYLPSFLARHRDFSPEAILRQLETAVTITAALQSLPATRDAPAAAAGLAPVEDIRLVPAWDTFAVAPDTPAIASVLAGMFEGDSPWLHCPRFFLQRMQQKLTELSLSLEAGFEVEFYLLCPTDDAGAMPVPVDRTLYASLAAAQKSEEFIGEVLRSLWAQGVPVEQYNPEAGPGQHEITLEHCAPLRLADRLIRVRETLRAAAERRGLRVSFLPLLFETATGSGLHTHMSLWKDGRNVLADPAQKWGLSETGNGFMAGILEHLPALMTATTPSVNSFRRIRPHEWSGAYQAWGIANKEAAVRLITDSLTGEPRHFELKTVDAAANPYIALGAIVAAGLDGIQRGLLLPEPVEVDPGNFATYERERLGIRPLPTSLETSLDYFVNDETLRDAMQPDFARVFAAVRRAELEGLSGLSFEEERLLLLERY